MKLLLSAFATCPEWGSEPSVGWNAAAELSQTHEVWVLTEKVWEKRIADRVDLSQFPNLHFVYVDIPWMHEIAEHRFNRGISWTIYYYLWQFQALKVARPLHQTHGFDLVQHVTFVKVSMPSLLYRLPIPFVFGPVGGAEFAPALEFFDRFGSKLKLVEMLRKTQVRLAAWDPLLRACVQRSACALGVTQASTAYLKRLGAHTALTLPAISLLPSECPAQAPVRSVPQGPIRFIYVGRLLGWKGVDLALEALSYHAKNYPPSLVQFDVVGDGPKRAELEHLAETLGIQEQVRFHGAKTRQEVLDHLATSDVLFFPSLHDSGGFVVIESMVRACPVLCLDLGGPGELVDDNSGWKIPAHSRHETLHALSEAIQQICQNRQAIYDKGQAARSRVLEHYTSKALAKKLESIFLKILPSRRH